MAKHTPGPWLTEYAETRMRWPAIYVEDAGWDGGRRQIAEVSLHVAKKTKGDKWRKTPEANEAEADARLIAAAPDLLAALRGLRHGPTRGTWCFGECLDHAENHSSACERARAAIVKATQP